jgi:S1-C subfamily serine protease/Tfp pilus assembly protein PilF
MASEDVDKLITFGQMALEQGWYEQAREYFEQAVALNAHSEEAWLQLAKLADEREQALACLDKVLSINPENVEARRRIDRLRRQTDPHELRAMLQIAMETGDKQAARSYCLKILDADPNDEQTWITLGRSCDDWDEALAHFRQALAINPGSEQAKTEIKHVLEQRENHYWAFAEGAMESGDKERAHKYLRKVLEVNPKNEQVWLELAGLASDPQEALGYLRHVLTINPANERARAAIRQIKEEQEAGRLRARQELEQAKVEEERTRWGHFIGASDEPVEPSRKVVWRWGIPSMGRGARIGIVLVSVLLIIGFVAMHLEDTSVPVTESEPTPTMTFREAIERTQQATVALGVPWDETCQYAGSGAVVDSKGLIVTNSHVVGGRYTLCVMFAKEVGGETYWYYNARVLKRDTSRDLALLKVARNADGTVATNVSLNAVPMGDSDKLYAGDTVYICGYPAVGGYNVTLTQGLVSGFEAGRTLIKTDAEISPGSSGGTAVTENGLLIGIPTFVQAQPLTAGKIGYLIPVNEVRHFLQSYQGQ